VSQDQVHLLWSRRFLPLFLVQFLGAFNDNLFKNALVILVTYRAAAQQGIPTSVLVTLGVGIFIFPYFIFSATAGQLADGREKSRLIQWVKFAEIPIMALGALGLWIGNVWFLLFVLFLTGTQAAFFGPLKYGILPDHLAEDELIAGNGLIESTTFIAILAGTMAGGLLVLAKGGIFLIGVFMLTVAVMGYVASRYIPPAPQAAPGLRVNPNIWAETRAMMSYAAERRDVFLAILGIAWFWFLGSTFLAQFPNYAKAVIGGNEQVVTLFLVAFSVGIAVGSLMCNRLLKGVVSARFVPWAALAMTVFMIDLYFAMGLPATPPATFMGAAEYMADFTRVRVLLDFALIAVAGGIYIVPLYAMVQERSLAAHRARTIASLNIIDSLFMVGSSVFAILLFALGLSVREVFLAVAIANLGAVLIWRKLALL
jgi:acyl-[acyl-carrier-protein]-phospholipid O-acyltransferase/long-chain-fatty-acid--[acyl-carrier-protein] ligase